MPLIIQPLDKHFRKFMVHNIIMQGAMHILRVSIVAILMLLSLKNSRAAPQGDSISVYIFLSETCPICQSNTLELKKIYEEFSDKGITFTGLFPNVGMSTDAGIKKFGKKYSIPFTLKLDKNGQLAKALGATTTPQVFVIKNANNQMLYNGKMDNRFEAIGKRREVVTEHYLQSALQNILQNKLPEPARTEPVGCFIIQ